MMSAAPFLLCLRFPHPPGTKLPVRELSLQSLLQLLHLAPRHITLLSSAYAAWPTVEAIRVTYHEWEIARGERKFSLGSREIVS